MLMAFALAQVCSVMARLMPPMLDSSYCDRPVSANNRASTVPKPRVRRVPMERLLNRLPIVKRERMNLYYDEGKTLV